MGVIIFSRNECQSMVKLQAPVSPHPTVILSLKSSYILFEFRLEIAQFSLTGLLMLVVSRKFGTLL